MQSCTMRGGDSSAFIFVMNYEFSFLISLEYYPKIQEDLHYQIYIPRIGSLILYLFQLLLFYYINISKY